MTSSRSRQIALLLFVLSTSGGVAALECSFSAARVNHTKGYVGILLCAALICAVLSICSVWYLAKTFWMARIPKGSCQGCGYDLTGNVSGRCPECGREIR